LRRNGCCVDDRRVSGGAAAAAAGLRIGDGGLSSPIAAAGGRNLRHADCEQCGDRHEDGTLKRHDTPLLNSPDEEAMEAGTACRRRYGLPVTDLLAAWVVPPELMELMEPVDRCALAGADHGDGRQKLARRSPAAWDRPENRSPGPAPIGSTSCDNRSAPEAAAAGPPAD